jgi:hypothetical protein
MFPNDLAPSAPFAMWTMVSIASAIKNGEIINKDTMHMSMPSTLEAMSHQSMYVYGNHICVSSVKEHFKTSDCGIAKAFEQECISSWNDQRPILAKLEYVGQVEEILELNYMVFNTIVLLCNLVKANYTGSSATIKRDAYGFTFINFSSFILIFDYSIAFPLHVEQVFFSGAPKEQGWKVVL